MPRTFTITFSHNNHSYLAVVTHLQTAICIYIPDESLHYTVPHGRFTYDLEQGLNLSSFHTKAAQHLMLDVIAAIELQMSA